ncbi:MAG: hypothetical protein NC548_11040 [Lachnospiraceae bacterium]|nr:hypothetical protein [Lachnospiraceae bacterium]
MKVTLDKEQETSLVTTGSSFQAVSEQIGDVTDLSDIPKRMLDPCPRCGKVICICSLLGIFKGDYPNDGL